MDRRKFLKLLPVTTLLTGSLVSSACKQETAVKDTAPTPPPSPAPNPLDKEYPEHWLEKTAKEVNPDQRYVAFDYPELSKIYSEEQVMAIARHRFEKEFALPGEFLKEAL